VLGDLAVFVSHLFDLVPDLVAVGEPARRPDVSGYDKLAVARDDAAAFSRSQVARLEIACATSMK